MLSIAGYFTVQFLVFVVAVVDAVITSAFDIALIQIKINKPCRRQCQLNADEICGAHTSKMTIIEREYITSNK